MPAKPYKPSPRLIWRSSRRHWYWVAYCPVHGKHEYSGTYTQALVENTHADRVRDCIKELVEGIG